MIVTASSVTKSLLFKTGHVRRTTTTGGSAGGSDGVSALASGGCGSFSAIGGRDGGNAATAASWGLLNEVTMSLVLFESAAFSALVFLSALPLLLVPSFFFPRTPPQHFGANQLQKSDEISSVELSSL